MVTGADNVRVATGPAATAVMNAGYLENDNADSMNEHVMSELYICQQ